MRSIEATDKKSAWVWSFTPSLALCQGTTLVVPKKVGAQRPPWFGHPGAPAKRAPLCDRRVPHICPVLADVGCHDSVPSRGRLRREGMSHVSPAAIIQEWP
jgi:hypothetical protein